MKRTHELSPALQSIAEKVQNLIASPVSESLDVFSKLEYETYIESNEPTIKEELAKISDIELINSFVKDVPAQNLSLSVFPEFVWNEISFAENILLSSTAYEKFSEKIRATPHIISEAIHSNGMNVILEESIPASALNNQVKMSLLIGAHDCLINMSGQDMWNNKKFVEHMLFDEDVPNRESIDQYSYIEILRRVPPNIIDEELAQKIAEKFQLGYSQLPGEMKLKPEFAILGLNNHIANIEAIPEETLDNPEVIMSAVKATKILDDFRPHAYDSYHPFGHLERLYNNPTFKKLNILEIEPLQIPGHSQEFTELLEKEFKKIYEIKPEVVFIPPSPSPFNKN